MLLIATAAGLPLFTAIAGVALLGLQRAGIDTAVVAVAFHRLASTPTLTALPLFTFAGLLLAASRAPQRFLLLARALVGHVPGGISIVAIIVSVGFTAFTGASGVTIIALGGLLLPALLSAAKSRGRVPAERFGIGLVTAAGGPGLLLPPSLPVIVYAVTAGVSVDRLFLATAVPALVLVAILAAYAAGATRRRGQADAARPRRPFSGRRAWRALRASAWELPLPVAVVGAIYGGAITVTEAATLTAAYVVLVEIGIRREVQLRLDLPRVLHQTAVMVGAILIVVGAALALTNMLVDALVPQRLLAAVAGATRHPLVFLLALNLVLLVAGMLIDVFSAIVVLVPLAAPIAAAVGVDPLHLAVVFLVNLEVGYLTPPVGINLFVARFRFRRPLGAVYRAALPYAALMIGALAIITYLPQLSLWLPGLAAETP